MKKARSSAGNDLRAEYDFDSMQGGVRGKHAASLHRGSNVVVLEPDVAAAFPSAEAVNEALRAVMRASRLMRRVRPRADDKARPVPAPRR